MDDTTLRLKCLDLAVGYFLETKISVTAKKVREVAQVFYDFAANKAVTPVLAETVEIIQPKTILEEIAEVTKEKKSPWNFNV